MRPNGADDDAPPESRLKIYSDLFEEVIERDRVFGSLLRKVKTAYDTMLMRGPEQDGRLPNTPLRIGPGVGNDSRWSHSNEPTTRAEHSAEASEMHRENIELKDLVERLHLELEEAIKREHRWKQKVVKLKAKAESVNTSQVMQQTPYGQPGPPGGGGGGGQFAGPPMPQDSWPPGYQAMPMQQMPPASQQMSSQQIPSQQMAAMQMQPMPQSMQQPMQQ